MWWLFWVGGALVVVAVALLMWVYVVRQDEIRSMHADRALMRGLAMARAGRLPRGVRVGVLPDDAQRVPADIRTQALDACGHGGGAIGLAFAVPFAGDKCVVAWENARAWRE
jgi:hypothetical protein